MTRYTWMLLLVLLVSACSQKEKGTEVVEETHPDGKPKKVAVYVDNAGKKQKIQETLYYPNGQIEQDGKLNENTLREGKWTYWYNDGKTWSEYEYQNGMRHGSCKVYFPNGQIRYAGQWEQDQPVGNWKFWTNAGKLEREANYAPTAAKKP
ncbi:MAG: toxin-antitoxin system YwqK family antitoxin [Salibacteraceae bacterium]